MRRSGGAAAVGPCEHLEQVPVGILEVDAAAAVVMVDLARPPSSRIGPVREPALSDAAEDGVELVLADEERVVLGVRSRLPVS